MVLYLEVLVTEALKTHASSNLNLEMNNQFTAKKTLTADFYSNRN